MKKVILILLVLLCVGCGGTKFYFFGVDMDVVKEAKGKDWAYTGAGVMTSVGMHIGGHWLAGEIFDVDFKFRDYYTKEEITDYDSDSDLRWMARGGFVLQHSVGLALTSFETTRYSYFTKGYVGSAALGTWFYPLYHYNSDYHDFKLIDDAGGNGDLEYALYSTVALHNLLRVPWYKLEENQTTKK
jgi:hypothetical protein